MFLAASSTRWKKARPLHKGRKFAKISRMNWHSDHQVDGAPGLLERGFTLIELMIVVGIIGILVSLTGPQYRKYSNRARQSEAKLGLAAIYSLEKAFYAEYSAYISSFNAIGFSPEGDRRFYGFALASDCLATGVVTGYSGSNGTPCHYANASSLTGAYTAGPGCAGGMNSTDYPANSQVFMATAPGNLKTPYDDVWMMDHLKVIRNCSIGI